MFEEVYAHARKERDELDKRFAAVHAEIARLNTKITEMEAGRIESRERMLRSLSELRRVQRVTEDAIDSLSGRYTSVPGYEPYVPRTPQDPLGQIPSIEGAATAQKKG